MANVGDIVVFKHHVCTIAQKRENYFDGKDYWELHAVFEKSLKLFVACDAAKSPAMRPAMQKEESHARSADTKPPRSTRNTSIWPKGFYATSCRFRLRFHATK